MILRLGHIAISLSQFGFVAIFSLQIVERTVPQQNFLSHLPLKIRCLDTVRCKKAIARKQEINCLKSYIITVVDSICILLRSTLIKTVPQSVGMFLKKCGLQWFLGFRNIYKNTLLSYDIRFWYCRVFFFSILFSDGKIFASRSPQTFSLKPVAV